MSGFSLGLIVASIIFALFAAWAWNEAEKMRERMLLAQRRRDEARRAKAIAQFIGENR